MKRNIDIEGFYRICISFSQTIRSNALEANQNQQSADDVDEHEDTFNNDARSKRKFQRKFLNFRPEHVRLGTL